MVPGDTLSGLASRYGVTVEELAELNRIANPNLIFVGDTLQIPDSGADGTGTGTPATTVPPIPPAVSVPPQPPATSVPPLPPALPGAPTVTPPPPPPIPDSPGVPATTQAPTTTAVPTNAATTVPPNPTPPTTQPVVTAVSPNPPTTETSDASHDRPCRQPSHRLLSRLFRSCLSPRRLPRLRLHLIRKMLTATDKTTTPNSPKACNQWWYGRPTRFARATG